jgi:hypothetical protein
MPDESEWLVEIRVHEWVCLPASQDRFVIFEEVIAHSEEDAWAKAKKQFDRRCQFEPATRQKMLRRGLTAQHCVPRDAVRI